MELGAGESFRCTIKILFLSARVSVIKFVLISRSTCREGLCFLYWKSCPKITLESLKVAHPIKALITCRHSQKGGGKGLVLMLKTGEKWNSLSLKFKRKSYPTPRPKSLEREREQRFGLTGAREVAVSELEGRRLGPSDEAEQWRSGAASP